MARSSVSVATALSRRPTESSRSRYMRVNSVGVVSRARSARPRSEIVPLCRSAMLALRSIGPEDEVRLVGVAHWVGAQLRRRLELPLHPSAHLLDGGVIQLVL